MWYVRSAPAHVHVDMLALWMRICGSMDVDVDVDVDAMLTVGLLSSESALQVHQAPTWPK